MKTLLEYIKKTKITKYYTELNPNMNKFDDILKVVKQFNHQHFEKTPDSGHIAVEMALKNGDIVIRELSRDIKIITIPVESYIKFSFYFDNRGKYIEHCSVKRYKEPSLDNGNIIYDGPFNSKFVDLFNETIEDFNEK